MTRRLLATVAVLLVALALPLGAAAQAPDIEARAELDQADVTLGDRARVTVTVLHPDSVLVDVVPPAASGTLRVVDTPPPTTQPAAEAGRSLTRFEFVLAAFSLGPQQLPPLVVTWLEEDGNSGQTEAPVPPLNVRSTVAADDTAPRPLKPQLAVEGAPPAWQVPAAIRRWRARAPRGGLAGRVAAAPAGAGSGRDAGDGSARRGPGEAPPRGDGTREPAPCARL